MKILTKPLKNKVEKLQNEIADLVYSHASQIDIIEPIKLKSEIKQVINSTLEEIAKEQRNEGFDHGYLAAVANLINLHGVSTEASETFRQHFDDFESAKKCNISDFDINEISKLFPND